MNEKRIHHAQAENVEVRVEMLGGFAIICGGLRITEPGKKSSKVWRLIQYLVTHRDRQVPQEELLEIFCGDDRGAPGSVLRTMVYRARTTLADEGLPFASNIITAKSGCYSWNSSIRCTTDIGDLEELSKKAAAAADEGEKLSLLLKVTELYKGDFLKGSSGDMWVVPLVRWYRSIYISAVHEVLALLIARERISEAEELAVKALRFDPFDETLIVYYLRTLLAQKKSEEALKMYKKMEAMFFDELGVDFSEELHALYGEIQNAGVSDDAPLSEVVTGWLADMDTSNLFYCDPSDFKVLCQVESRSALRSGSTAYIIRFNTKYEPDPKVVAKGGGVMKNLEKAITLCLRASDIYTRFGPNQFMLLLRSLTYEDCKMLISKILSKVDSKYLGKITDTSVMHITPSGEYKNASDGLNYGGVLDVSMDDVQFDGSYMDDDRGDAQA